LPPKIQKIQEQLPAWVQTPGNQEKAAAFMQKLKEQLDAKNFAEAEKTADSILKTMGVSAPAAAPAIPQETSSYAERLPLKIQKIQKELPAWVEMPGNKEKAAAFMQKLKEQLDAKNFSEAEKTADAILKTMGVSAPVVGQRSGNKPQPTAPSNPPSNDPTKRLTEKVERVQAGVQKWIASGRDPSPIGKAMQEKFKPLMEAGKVVEAEAELDRILEQLGDEGAASDAPAIPQDTSSYEERLPPKIHRIQKELPVWNEKPGNKEKAAAFMQKLKEHLDAMNFAEAEKTADAFLAAMGVKVPTAGQSGENKPQPMPRSSPPSNETTKRLTEKVERVKAGVQKWAASGRHPSTIIEAMQEKFKPLMEAGKVVEAEAVLDRVLEQLNKDAN
jgi:hypothetical protein